MAKQRRPRKERSLVDRLFDEIKPKSWASELLSQAERASKMEDRLPLHYRESGRTTQITFSGIEPEPQSTWTCASDEVNECPIASKPSVYIPFAMFRLWTEMAFRIDTEWMAYLTGEQTARGLEVREMYFPAQTVSGAHVDTVDALVEIKPGTIGKVHSHAQMGAFFSAQDEAHQNWPVELVINAKGEVVARQRVKLECGRWSRVDSKVLLVGSQEADSRIAEVKAAIAAGGKWGEENKPKLTLPILGSSNNDHQSKVLTQVADDVPVHIVALEDWTHE